mgnify:CR=1 FL=1
MPMQINMTKAKNITNQVDDMTTLNQLKAATTDA